MSYNVIGKVKEEEKKEIEIIFEHLEALKCLVSSLSDEVIQEDDNIYKKFIEEFTEVNWSYRTWWDKMAKKYSWPIEDRKQWFINFYTNEILLA
jgi:CXXX repeat modification system protein